MTALTLMAAALEQELLTRGVTVLDRADCEAIILAVMQRTAQVGGIVAVTIPEQTP